jgi:hypothetical protein
MDGKGRDIDNIFWKDYGGQSNTRMYIYKHILTESAFTEDLKIILNFIIHATSSVIRLWNIIILQSGIKSE